MSKGATVLVDVDGVDSQRWGTPRHASGAARPGSFTISDFLKLPVTVEGLPVVLAGADQLGRSIRWVHVIELADTKGLLQGGELILTTGIALPQDPGELRSYIDGLADQGVVGLVIELGWRYAEVPPEMVRACERRSLPLVALRREVPFVKMTEAVHSALLDDRRRLLETMATAHERFTELTLAEAPAEELVRVAAELADGQVVFTNLLHQVLALDARDGSVELLLNRWQRKAQTLASAFGTETDERDGTVTTPVVVRGRQRGRLTLFTSGVPALSQVVVLERAAAALAIQLLIEDEDALVAKARRSVLADLVASRYTSPETIHARAAALGHTTRNRRFLPLVLLGAHQDLSRPVRRALHDTHLDALHGPLTADRWGVLLLLHRQQGEEQAETFARRLHELCEELGLPRLTIGMGGIVTDFHGVRPSFLEAGDVAQAAQAGAPYTRARWCYRIQDIQLRGLLYTLRHEPRLQAFAERTLSPLLARDAKDGSDLVRTLAVYLRLRGNKSLAAQELGISRPTLYDRLARVRRLLQVDLDDPEVSTSLYAAIMVVETMPADPPDAAR